MRGRSIRWLLAFAVAGLVAAPAADATYLGHNGKIAYDRSTTEVHEGVWTMNPDGSDESQLIASGASPAWSADGLRLAYQCRDAGGRLTVCTADQNGTSINVLDNFDRHYVRPSWSPDGRRIAADSDHGCTPHICFSQLWSLDSADGSDAYELATGGLEASWGVNRVVAFQSRWLEPDPDNPGFPRVRTEIRVVDPVHPGTNEAIPGTDGGSGPDWSPDGRRILFSKQSEIFAVDRDGANLARLTNNSVSDFEPAWSPDGTKIVFVRSAGGTYDIWTMNADGTGETQLTHTPDSYENSPAWRPAEQGPYPHPASAAKISVSLVPAFQQCTEPNRNHGPPLAAPSCAPPRQRAGFMTFGSTPRGTSTKAVGHARIAVVPGDPDSENRADVRMSVRLTDVRRADNLADPPGSLDFAVLPLRITDRSNGPFDSPHAATVVDYTDTDYETYFVHFELPCVATPDPSIGSTCAATTSANTLMPFQQDVIRERRRTIWEIPRVAVWDGGPDGHISSRDDNQLIAVQGLFVP